MNEQQQSDFEMIHGASYPLAKYHIGDVITFADHSQPTGRDKGQIVHVITPADGRPGGYIVSPTIGVFPVEIGFSEVIEAPDRCAVCNRELSPAMIFMRNGRSYCARDLPPTDPWR